MFTKRRFVSLEEKLAEAQAEHNEILRQASATHQISHFQEKDLRKLVREMASLKVRITERDKKN